MTHHLENNDEEISAAVAAYLVSKNIIFACDFGYNDDGSEYTLYSLTDEAKLCT